MRFTETQPTEITSPGNTNPKTVRGTTLRREYLEFEREVTHNASSLSREKKLERIAALRETALPDEQPFLDFTEAMVLLEDANIDLAGFRHELASAAEKHGKPALAFNRTEYVEIFRNYEKGETKSLQTKEREILALLDNACKYWWRGQYTDPLIASLYKNEILYRQSTRILDNTERQTQQQKINQAFERLISEMQPRNSGIADEYRFQFLVRQRTQRLGNDHVIFMEHELPHMDNTNLKIDSRLYFGSDVANLQIKSWNMDHHTPSDVAAEQQKVRGTTRLMILDHATLREAYEASHGKGFSDAKERILFGALTNALPTHEHDLLGTAIAPTKAEKNPDDVALSSRYALRVIDLPFLRQYGLIDREINPTSPDGRRQYLAIQQRVAEVLPRVIRRRGDLKHPTPEQIKQIQQAMEVRPAGSEM